MKKQYAIWVDNLFISDYIEKEEGELSYVIWTKSLASARKFGSHFVARQWLENKEWTDCLILDITEEVE